jgi:arylsulfatase A-like enzyme
MPSAGASAAFALAALLAACADGAPAWRPPLRLLDSGTLVRLADEARWSSGGSGAEVVEGIFDGPTALPSRGRLPADFAGEPSVVAHVRCWASRVEAAEIAERSLLLAVEAGSGGPEIALDALRESCAQPRPHVRVTAFRMRERPTYRVRRAAAAPPDAVLEFGYAVRAETWDRSAAPVRFRVWEGDGPRPLFEARVDPRRPEQRRWFDASVDLSEFAGREIALIFETTREGEGMSLPVWSDPTLRSSRAVSPLPNLVVVSIDTLRAQSLGAYGYGRDTSPFLDSLAAQGTLFENAIAPATTTAPSHMSLFSGLYPVRHGVLTAPLSAPPEVESFVQRLRGAGYRTAAFTEDGNLSLRSGFGRGFSQYVESVGERGRALGEVRATFARARAWLESNRAEPFFLFVHTYQVHAPYDPPEEYRRLFAGDGLAGPADPEARALRDDYDREIRLVDDELRGLVAALERASRPGAAIALVVSDHGEEFAEHGLFQHGAAVFDEALRVPLVFWGPGRIPAGRRVAGQVSLVDVAPTLLALAGSEPPEGLDGRSLLPSIDAGAPPEPRTLYSEARAGVRYTGASETESWSPPLVSLRREGEKWIVHRPERGTRWQTLRFDLARDPLERSPLPLADGERERAEERASEYLAEAVPALSEPEALDPELRERLRLLGYAE